MKIRMLFLLLLASFFAPARSSAQGCQGVMTPEYSSYFSYSYDGTYLHTSVLVDGSAIIHPSEYCNLSGASHRGVATNKLNGVGGQLWGPPTTPSGYISVTNAQDIVGGPGVPYSDSTNEEVICNFLGAFFNTGGLINIEVAYTRFITGAYYPQSTPPPPVRYYTIYPYCTPATTPPDWTGAGLYWVTSDPPNVPTQVVDGKTACIRIGNSGPWTCAPAGVFTGGSWNLPFPLGNCTHNP